MTIGETLQTSERIREAARKYRGYGLQRVPGPEDIYIMPSRQMLQGYVETSTAHVEGRTFYVYHLVGAE